MLIYRDKYLQPRSRQEFLTTALRALDRLNPKALARMVYIDPQNNHMCATAAFGVHCKISGKVNICDLRPAVWYAMGHTHEAYYEMRVVNDAFLGTDKDRWHHVRAWIVRELRVIDMTAENSKS